MKVIRNTLLLLPLPVNHFFILGIPMFAFSHIPNWSRVYSLKLTRKKDLRQLQTASVLVLPGMELVFFLNGGRVPCFSFGMRITLVTHWCFSVWWHCISTDNTSLTALAHFKTSALKITPPNNNPLPSLHALQRHRFQELTSSLV